MSKHGDYVSKTEQLIMPILEEKNYELIDIEFVKEGSQWYLRAYVDKEGGITLDDLEYVTRALNPLLDEDEFIEEAYILEISSPGVDRPLKKDKDFERNLEKPIEIKFYKAIDGEKVVVGILKEYDKEKVVIADEDDNLKTFDRADISIIRPWIDF